MRTEIIITLCIMLAFIVMAVMELVPQMAKNKFRVGTEFEWKGHTYQIKDKSESYIIVRDENGQKSTINLAEESLSTLWSIDIRKSDPFNFPSYETTRMSLELVREPKFNLFDEVREVDNKLVGLIKAVYNKDGDICYDVHYRDGNASMTVTGCAESNLEKVVTVEAP